MKNEKESSPKKILVAEDDESAGELLRIIVKSAGYEVSMAQDGKEALAQMAEFRPDLILLDVLMPEIHGYSVCHRIKNDDLLKDTKVIMVTAKNSLADQRQAQEAGADAFLCKPVAPSAILDKISALLLPA